LAPGEAPNQTRSEDFPELVGVLDTNDNFALVSACHALSRAGIIFDVVAVPDLPESLRTANPKWWIRPCRILVAKEDEPDARELAEPFQHPLADNEVDNR
jgi:hypothetical protein